ncbi:ABC transporter family substrate-binding protein [Streptomyces sp. NBC_01387]|uniref:ABC transporter family substrate-binding protein n=1 Tax=unclassified Streptomyces TaxID=2593676 RepID=UPI0020252CA8|nr:MULTISPECIES: ABC transporter family substrate-binding protein [unclassified Streptomyces]MCX4548459.1 ABC transporter family substrate-binding protein [Streptomyces sp. NBC_01500]WSC20079.1 ABC transporter family substrate-binding protein [Streptomyces sp. NBC_01766]WSV54100.1 ABC transporter family substrate-binding protein [Streptomyces sp. NBC_01014]
MSHVGVPHGRAKRRSVALLATGVLALPVLAGCGSSDHHSKDAKAVAPDVGTAARAKLADGGTLRWAVDSMPATLNTFQADAGTATSRVAGAVLPALFTLDAAGRPQLNGDYLESADVIKTEPKQVVRYRINQKAVWSNGREIGAPDFVAQWRALSGKDSGYWTARNAGYDRIEKIEKGKDDLEVEVTFNRPYADWRSLFTPLYPKEVMGTPDSFNDGARKTIAATAGPFGIKGVDRDAKETTLVRNPHWWGQQPKLDSLVLAAVPADRRTAALTAGSLDIADVDESAAGRITLADKDGNSGQPLTHGPGSEVRPADALLAWAAAHGADGEQAQEAASRAAARTREARQEYAKQQAALHSYVVRKSLQPAFTQLAMNGSSGPLSDERVRRAVARALDREQIATDVLKPLGLPARPPGSHLALAGQQDYADNSGSLGGHDPGKAQALLADAGWTIGGARRTEEGTKAGSKPDKGESRAPGSPAASDGPSASGKPEQSAAPSKSAKPESSSQDDSKPIGQARGQAMGQSGDEKHRIAGAYAPEGTAAPAAAAPAGALGKDGKALSLRFVLPSGPGTESLNSVGTKITRELDAVGIRTEITKVDSASYFKDHIASGDYDLALYSWPATAYPATDARPIYAKPAVASDGSLMVDQNYTRVGTDRIDQLFDRAAGELDAKAAQDLVKQADAHIWAAAGSIPLYQRPELVAVKPAVANAGAFGFATPRYQDIGFLKSARKS